MCTSMSHDGVVSCGRTGRGLASQVGAREVDVVGLMDYYATSPLWSDVDRSEVVARSVAYLWAIRGSRVDCDGYKAVVSEIFTGAASLGVVAESCADGGYDAGGRSVAGRVGGGSEGNVGDSGGSGVAFVDAVVDVGDARGDERDHGSGDAVGTGGSSVVDAEAVDECVVGVDNGGRSVPVETVCSVGGVDEVVSAKTLANRKKRQAKKNRKIRKQEIVPEWRRGAGLVSEGQQKSGQSSALRESVEAKWIAKNALEAEEARRKLAVLKANDVQEEVRRYRTRVQRHTEANMVSIEKTHALLESTGNVPGVGLVGNAEVDGGGSVETVVSGGSISPSSSASLQDVRKLQKELLDLQDENQRLRRGIESVKLDPDIIEYYNKEKWTIASDGGLASEHIIAADKIFPNGYCELGEPLRGEDGKYRTRLVTYHG